MPMPPDGPEIPTPPDDAPAPPAPATSATSATSDRPDTDEGAAPAPAHVRCFIAVNFPVATIRRIGDEIAALKGPVAAAGLKVRWVPTANIHLTLKFLGPVRLPAVEAIRSRLGRELPPLRGFELEARGMGAFPSPASPRVLWVGVTDPSGPSGALIALQQSIEAWMADLGFAREERRFHPHLTVGRVSHGHGGGSLAAILDERAAKSFGGGRVAEVVIYESRTMAQGAEYHALGRVPLGPG
jgi:2'-5' RNA ligase